MSSSIITIIKICTIINLVYLELLSSEVVLEMPIVGKEMSDMGFHRNLIFTIQFDYPFAGRECEYILEQHLPASVYVNTDELDDLQRLGMLEASYPDFIDVEMSTERAAPFSVLLHGMPKISDTITLPINFRYHAADNKNSSVVVDIDTPIMYMHCSAENNVLLEEEIKQLQKSHSKYCLNGNSMSVSNDAETGCAWRMINVQFQLKSSLRANIPIGNKRFSTWVLNGTIALSWLACILIIWRTYTIPYRINQKLVEQLILEKKLK